MISKINKSLCSGCLLCSSVCPNKCIHVHSDDLGFQYVKEDESCIKCGRCLKVCPVNRDKCSDTCKDRVVYAAYSKDKNIQLNSSSGGLYYLIAKYFISNGEIVIAPLFDNEMHLKHTIISNEKELQQSVGSKYVQSDMSNVYTEIKKHQNAERKILFVGTPCQVYAVRRFFEINKGKELFTIEIACHGVSGPGVFKKYIDEQQTKHKDKINRIAFREKMHGWEDYFVTIEFKSGGKLSIPKNDDLYMRSFLNNYSLRESCFNCKFKNFQSGSDLTLSDFWGIQELDATAYDKNGVSAVYINTYQGRCIFEAIKENLTYYEEPYSAAVSSNPALITSTLAPINIEDYRQRFSMSSLDQLDDMFICKTLKNRIKKRIKRLIRRIEK